MSIIIKTGFILAGVLNLLPIVGAVSAAQVERLYAVDVPDADLALMLRHRAVLLAIVGCLLLVAAFRSELRLAAALAGLASMGVYVALAYAIPGANANLMRVAHIDVAGVVILVIALAAHLRQG